MKQFPIKILRIESAIAAAAGITIAELRSFSRDPIHSKARQAVWYVAYVHLGFTYRRLADLYDRKDHTTVMFGVNKLRGSDEAKAIMEGIKKVCPDVLSDVQQPAKASATTWSFT